MMPPDLCPMRFPCRSWHFAEDEEIRKQVSHTVHQLLSVCKIKAEIRHRPAIAIVFL